MYSLGVKYSCLVFVDICDKYVYLNILIIKHIF